MVNNYEDVLGDLDFFSEILKKSGYRSASFGIAEIIDNSIDAAANNIVVIAESGASNRVKKIGILDDGCGMSDNVLKKCLQVGAHFEISKSGSRRGKFGFGLPGASAAHSNKVTVYSWCKKNLGEIYKVSLDVNDLRSGIPHPVRVDALPNPYEKLRVEKAVIENNGTVELGPINFYNHGTLVLWDDCERVTPKTTQILFRNHLAPSLSRLYRHFITEDTFSKKRFLRCNISLVYDLVPGRECTVMKLKPNDPLYIMKDHIHSDKLSFDLQEKLLKNFPLNKSNVEVRFSLSSRETRQNYKGHGMINAELGKNLGISIVREGRELDFGEFNFFDSSEDRHRFWGCEILFTKEADNFFGVPANKQHVDYLKHTFQIEGIDEYPEDTKNEDLPIWIALEKNFGLKSTISQFFGTIKSYAHPDTEEGNGESGVSGSPIDITDGEDEGEDDKDSTSGGSVDTKDESARKNAIQELINIGIENPTEQHIERLLKHKVVLLFVALGKNMGFMDVQIQYGICVLKINSESCFYRRVLSNIMDESEESARGVELLLLAYARCMDLNRNYENSKQFPRVLAKWSSKAEELLKDYYEGI